MSSQIHHFIGTAAPLLLNDTSACVYIKQVLQRVLDYTNYDIPNQGETVVNILAAATNALVAAATTTPAPEETNEVIRTPAAEESKEEDKMPPTRKCKVQEQANR